MTILGLLWFILAIIGAFILGVVVGRFHEGTLIIDGNSVGGGHHDSSGDHH